MNENKVKESNMVANGFLDAAYYLKKCEAKDMVLLGVYAPAYTANLAFACELYFKQLLYIKGIDVTRIHGLKKLYEKIPQDMQNEIIIEYQRNLQSEEKEIQSMTIQDCLDRYDTAFEDWRYIYEGNKKSNTTAEKDFFIW